MGHPTASQTSHTQDSEQDFKCDFFFPLIFLMRSLCFHHIGSVHMDQSLGFACLGLFAFLTAVQKPTKHNLHIILQFEFSDCGICHPTSKQIHSHLERWCKTKGHFLFPLEFGRRFIRGGTSLFLPQNY